MQVSLNWLNEFVDLSDIEVEQIAHELTMSGLEVEAVEELKPQFTNIKTVKIEKDGVKSISINNNGRGASVHIKVLEGELDIRKCYIEYDLDED